MFARTRQLIELAAEGEGGAAVGLQRQPLGARHDRLEDLVVEAGFEGGDARPAMTACPAG